MVDTSKDGTPPEPTETSDATTLRRAAVEALWHEGRQSWPNIVLSVDALAAWIDARAIPTAELGRLVAADIYLVAACLGGLKGAVEAFVAGPLAQVRRHIERMVEQGHNFGLKPDDFMQSLYLLLMAPGEDGAAPKLGQYTGRGLLGVWLRMTAVRRALNTTRGTPRELDFDAVGFDQVSDHDPELSVLRRRHRDEITRIFAAALASTSEEERLLLRLHYAQGVSLGDLATAFKTSRSTLHRRVEAARMMLLERIAALVRTRLVLTASEQGSLLRLFKSDLRDNLATFLRDEKDQGGRC